MDKLAKRAGVAMLVVLATAGSAFAWGLVRFASTVDAETPRLRLDAALRASALPLAAVAKPAPEAHAAAERLSKLATALNPRGEKAKKPPAKIAAPTETTPSAPARTSVAAAAPREPDLPRAEDLLDFGPGANEREAKLAERDAKAFNIRQLGGAEDQHRILKDSGERVTFETDLGRPGDH